MERKAKARELRRWHELILSSCGPKNAQSRLVALAIARHVDWSTFTTVVGAERLAADTALCERTVRDRIQELIRAAYLSARLTGHGRTWKLRELMLRWPASGAGHEDSRPVQDAGHEASRPVNGSSMTGTAASDDRHGVHPISSEITKEISSKSAASPSPAEAVSAAQGPKQWTDENLRLEIRKMRKLHWSDDRILKKYAKLGMRAAHFESPHVQEPAA